VSQNHNLIDSVQSRFKIIGASCKLEKGMRGVAPSLIETSCMYNITWVIRQSCHRVVTEQWNRLAYFTPRSRFGKSTGHEALSTRHPLRHQPPRCRWQLPRSLSRERRDLREPRRTRLPPYPRRRTSARKHAWST
jgi:hypothetical protein